MFAFVENSVCPTSIVSKIGGIQYQIGAFFLVKLSNFSGESICLEFGSDLKVSKLQLLLEPVGFEVVKLVIVLIKQTSDLYLGRLVDMHYN